MSYSFIYTDLLARYIKPRQPVKFYGRLEMKYNKTMNDKMVLTENDKGIMHYSNVVNELYVFEYLPRKSDLKKQFRSYYRKNYIHICMLYCLHLYIYINRIR